MKTKFASAERSEEFILKKESDFLNTLDELHYFLDTMPNFVIVLNENRQIVYSNKIFMEFLGIDSVDPILGLRPGEVVNCIHSDEETGGCGTSEACRECGAIQAVLESQTKSIQSAKECRISLKNNEALDLLVWATPFTKNEHKFTLTSLTDISPEKRRRALERIFFHDVLNTAGSLRGFLEIIEDIPAEERTEYLKIMQGISENLIEEIHAQKQLTAAEQNEYQLDLSEFYSYDIIKDVKESFIRNPVADGKTISIVESDNVKLFSDKTLMRRVLINLVKNALEAIDKSGCVKLYCSSNASTVEFKVHNNSVMSNKIKNQIFQRSFSTKGIGRGLGTYSIKLLTEKYLDGKVSFTSELPEGTTFKVQYPISLDQKILLRGD